MKININAPGAYQAGIRDIIRVFYPEFETSTAGHVVNGNFDAGIILSLQQSRDTIRATAQIQYDSREQKHEEHTRITPESDINNESRRIARLAVYRLLAKHTGDQPSPWGILTNTRPTKIVHRLLDRGYTPGEVTTSLKQDFALRSDKANLMTRVAQHQRPFLPVQPGTGREIAIYISVPFCPSRCLYCSFPSYPRHKYGQWLQPFVNALIKEIKAVGQFTREKSLQVRCIYLGGGTPTCLEPLQLSEILETAQQYLPANTTPELTVEGGRPETLTGEVIQICREAGTSRMSINPQSMQENTLQAIGRRHTPEEIVTAVKRCRQAGLNNINMDLIAGLPGEGREDMRDTLDKIAPMKPENLSVHTLAVKKSSRLRHEMNSYPLPSPRETAAMVEEAARQAGLMGMIPYYMYRQKNMPAQMENVGYTVPGRECLYNIMIMEERNSVLGTGAGAGSKYIFPGGTLLNRHNPKDPVLYVDRIDNIIQKKIQELQDLSF